MFDPKGPGFEQDRSRIRDALRNSACKSPYKDESARSRRACNRAFVRWAGNRPICRQILPNSPGEPAQGQALWHRAKLLRGNSYQRAESLGKGAQRGITDFEANLSNRGLRFQEQFLGPLHAQASQEMMRRRACDLVKNPHEVKLADRSDRREALQVQRLLQTRTHVAHDAFDRLPIGFDRVCFMGCRERKLTSTRGQVNGSCSVLRAP